MPVVRHGYGELPPHPIEAKMKLSTPEGWAAVAVVGERELYEPTPMNQTKAEQLDSKYGPDNWAVTRHEMPDREPTQLLDVIVSDSAEAEPTPHEIVVDVESDTYQIPVSTHELGKTATQNAKEE